MNPVTPLLYLSLILLIGLVGIFIIEALVFFKSHRITKIKSWQKAERRYKINTFDIDGVIFLNKEVGGVHPAPHDILITGRSFQEVPETRKMLRDRGIFNRVYFNRAKFDDKTRLGSGIHKAETIKRLQRLGYIIMCHFEDDEVQADVIRTRCPEITVVMLVHNLTEKENVRHEM